MKTVIQNTVGANVASAFIEEKERKERIETAFIGLCRHQLGSTPPEVRFGLVNQRPLEEVAVKALQAKFFSQGVRRNDPDTVIHVGVDASLINLTQLKQTMCDIGEYNDLADAFLDTVAIKRRVVHAYSGQHRAAAMRTFQEKVLDPRMVLGAREVLRLMNRVTAIKSDIAEGDSVDPRLTSEILPEVEAQLEKEQELLNRIQGLINEETYWAIKLYDRSKL